MINPRFSQSPHRKKKKKKSHVCQFSQNQKPAGLHKITDGFCFRYKNPSKYKSVHSFWTAHLLNCGASARLPSVYKVHSFQTDMRWRSFKYSHSLRMQSSTSCSCVCELLEEAFDEERVGVEPTFMMIYAPFMSWFVIMFLSYGDAALRKKKKIAMCWRSNLLQGCICVHKDYSILKLFRNDMQTLVDTKSRLITAFEGKIQSQMTLISCVHCQPGLAKIHKSVFVCTHARL